MTTDLVFSGSTIHVRDELVNLTDMWRAAGSDRARRPVVWLSQERTRALIEALRSAPGFAEVTQNDLGVSQQKGGKHHEELRAAGDLDRVADVWRLTLEARRADLIEGVDVSALQLERDDATERLSPKGAS